MRSALSIKTDTSSTGGNFIRRDMASVYSRPRMASRMYMSIVTAI